MIFKSIKNSLGCLGIGIAILIIWVIGALANNLFDIGKSTIWNKTVGRVLHGPEWKQQLENKSYTMAIVLVSLYNDDSIENRTKLKPIIEDLQKYSQTLPPDELEKLIAQLKSFKKATMYKRFSALDQIIGQKNNDDVDNIIKLNIDNFTKNKGLARGWREFSRELDRVATKTQYEINNDGLSEKERNKLIILSQSKDFIAEEMDAQHDWIINDMTRNSSDKIK